MTTRFVLQMIGRSEGHGETTLGCLRTSTSPKVELHHHALHAVKDEDTSNPKGIDSKYHVICRSLLPSLQSHCSLSPQYWLRSNFDQHALHEKKSDVSVEELLCIYIDALLTFSARHRDNNMLVLHG